jgi:arylsulfatase A
MLRRLHCFVYLVLFYKVHSTKRVNVILLLADDLGYGDLGWSPFNSVEMKAIVSPNLNLMAKNGVTLTNFHAASPVCSPSRAAIMVGLFPWRMGVDFIYAGDLKKDGSQEMDHEQLPLVPNIAMSFRDAGYFTAHIGKWHLGRYDV